MRRTRKIFLDEGVLADGGIIGRFDIEVADGLRDIIGAENVETGLAGLLRYPLPFWSSFGFGRWFKGSLAEPYLSRRI